MTAASTLPFAESTNRIWDAIVIGAGPAGAVAAHQLAKHGLQTLLVERQAWPRKKVCGGCLNGRALAVLESIGIRHVLDDSLAAPLTRLIVQARQRCAEVDLPGGVAISRSEFDAALVNAAVSAGVKFLPTTKAMIAPQVITSEARQVTLSRNDENAQVATARIVIAADGLGHPSLNELPEFACQVSDGPRVGLSLIIERMPPSYRAGAIYMAVSRSGYVGLVRTMNGRGNLAAAIDLSAIKSAAAPAQVVRSILDDAGLPSPTFSERDTWRGTIPLMRQTNRLSARRLFLLGDAAGYAEPFTGEGIGWALASAVEITPLVISNLVRWNADSIDDWEKAQKRNLLRGQMISRTMAYLLRRPLAVHLALRVLSAMPALARPLVQKVYQLQQNAGLHLP